MREKETSARIATLLSEHGTDKTARPDSSLGVQMQVCRNLDVFPSSLGSGANNPGLISQKVYIKSFYKRSIPEQIRQLIPHVITQRKNKLTDL